jgi:hypothetical protein
MSSIAEVIADGFALIAGFWGEGSELPAAELEDAIDRAAFTGDVDSSHAALSAYERAASMSCARCAPALAGGNSGVSGCVDLATRFGDRYRLIHEEQVSEWPPAHRPWLARIVCRYGHVGVQGGERLYAFTDRHVAASLRKLSFVEKTQGGSELRIVFHVDHLAAVLAILRPYRRRRLSPAERARLVAAGASHRFGTCADDGVQSELPVPGSTHEGRRSLRPLSEVLVPPETLEEFRPASPAKGKYAAGAPHAGAPPGG